MRWQSYWKSNLYGSENLANFAAYISVADKAYARFGDAISVSLDAGLTFSTQYTLSESYSVYASDNNNIIIGGNFDTSRSNNSGFTFGLINHW